MSDGTTKTDKEILIETIEQLLMPSTAIKTSFFPQFGEYLGGMRLNELSLFCAPTGCGKTQWLASLVAHLVKHDVKVFVASIETGPHDFLKRVISQWEGIDLNEHENYSLEFVQKLYEKYSPILDEKIIFATYENRVSVDDIITRIAFAQQRYGVKIAVLDNLNFFLDVKNARDQLVEMDQAVHAFVIAAKHIPVHTLLVVHPKKTDGGRVESEFDIKGSSTAVQEASNVILMNRPKKEDIDSGKYDWLNREIVFKKIRKRGININKPIIFRYTNGRYGEVKK